MTVSDPAGVDDGKFDLYLVCPGAAWQLLAAATYLKFGFAKPDPLKRGSAQRKLHCERRRKTDQCRRGARWHCARDIRPNEIESVVDVTFRCLAAASAR